MVVFFVFFLLVRITYSPVGSLLIVGLRIVVTTMIDTKSQVFLSTPPGSGSNYTRSQTLIVVSCLLLLVLATLVVVLGSIAFSGHCIGYQPTTYNSEDTIASMSVRRSRLIPSFSHE